MASSTPFSSSLGISLASSAGLLAVVAVVAGNRGELALAAVASAGAMLAAAIGFALLRSARRLETSLEDMQRRQGDQEDSNRRFREAVAQLGRVGKLRERPPGSVPPGADEAEGESDEDRILRVVTEAAQLAVGGDRAVFWAYRPPNRLVARSGVGAPVGAVLNPGEGLAGSAARLRSPVLHPDATTLAGAEPERPSALAVPFFSRGNLLGVVAVYGRGPGTGGGPFGPDDLATLDTLVTQAGTAVDNVSLHTEAQRLSITDGLTGLWNRRQLELRCQGELERAVRFNRSVGLVFCDLDHFKDVNSEWLHTGGDAVLVEVAHRLSAATREIDVVARWGGEEFMLLLPETDLEGSVTVAEKVRRAMADEPITYGGRSRAVTLSLGVAAYPHSGTNLRTLNKAVAEALARAKAGGRNRIERAEPKIRGTSVG